MKLFFKTLGAALALPLALTACSSIQKTDLQHHHWNLVSIDGQAISADIKSDLEIGEGFRINGLAGCNRYFGDATLEGKKLVAPQLATTLMACHGEADTVERAVLNTLQSAKIVLKPQGLELVGEKHKLVYKLADWM